MTLTNHERARLWSLTQIGAATMTANQYRQWVRLMMRKVMWLEGEWQELLG